MAVKSKLPNTAPPKRPNARPTLTPAGEFALVLLGEAVSGRSMADTTFGIVVGAMLVAGDTEGVVLGTKEVGLVVGIMVGSFGIKQTLALASGSKSFKLCISFAAKNS